MSKRQKILCAALPMGSLLMAGIAAAEPVPVMEIVRDAATSPEVAPFKVALVPQKPGQSFSNLGASELQKLWMQALEERQLNNNQSVAIEVASWRRDCSEMGYPEDYHGVITGETQIDRQAGWRRDIWQSNNCVAPVALARTTPGAQIFAGDLAPLQLADMTMESQPALAREPVAEPAAEITPPLMTLAAVMPEAPQKIAVMDGACGAAARQMWQSAPQSRLCATGTASPVIGQGPWQWSCAGIHGGSTTPCFAMLDIAALAQRETKPLLPAPAPQSAQLVDSAKPAVAVKPAEIMKPVEQALPAPPVITAKTEPSTASAALVTPQLTTPVLTAEVQTRSAPLSSAALVTPRLDLAPGSNRLEPGTSDYRPAPPVRTAASLRPADMTGSGVAIDPALAQLKLESTRDMPNEDTLAQLELLGQKLAANRLARVTVTAYASMADGRDARGARRLSLTRAMAVRDALLLGGAGSDQIRLRALGANVQTGDADRIDLADH